MCWSIEQAKKCKYYSKMRVIVSTDSTEYQKIAKNYGAEVPFLRPKDISGDLSTDYECIQHCVSWLKKNENYNPDIILHLRPTQPCRKIEDINTSLNMFIQNIEHYDSLRSVIPVDKSPYKMYNIDNDKQLLKPLFLNVENIDEPYNQARQLLPKCYLHNGYIDILKTTILKNKTISGNKILPYLMNKEDNIDIDYEEDIIKIK